MVSDLMFYLLVLILAANFVNFKQYLLWIAEKGKNGDAIAIFTTTVKRYFHSHDHHHQLPHKFNLRHQTLVTGQGR